MKKIVLLLSLCGVGLQAADAAAAPEETPITVVTSDGEEFTVKDSNMFPGLKSAPCHVDCITFDEIELKPNFNKIRVPIESSIMQNILNLYTDNFYYLPVSGFGSFKEIHNKLKSIYEALKILRPKDFIKKMYIAYKKNPNADANYYNDENGVDILKKMHVIIHLEKGEYTYNNSEEKKRIELNNNDIGNINSVRKSLGAQDFLKIYPKINLN